MECSLWAGSGVTKKRIYSLLSRTHSVAWPARHVHMWHMPWKKHKEYLHAGKETSGDQGRWRGARAFGLTINKAQRWKMICVRKSKWPDCGVWGSYPGPLQGDYDIPQLQWGDWIAVLLGEDRSQDPFILLKIMRNPKSFYLYAGYIYPYSGIVFNFINLFNVQLNRGQLNSYTSFCIKSLMICFGWSIWRKSCITEICSWKERASQIPCIRQPLKCLLVIATSGSSHPLGVGWTWWFASKECTWQRWWDDTLKIKLQRLWLPSWVHSLLLSFWGESAAMVQAALWRSPSGKELRESSGQYPLRHWGPQRWAESCQQPWRSAWEQILPHLSHQMRLQPWPTLDLQPERDLNERHPA